MPTRVETLDNGLKVILRPIPDTKALSTWVVYRIGSRNEVPGMTGSTHWVEHMLFKGGGKLAKGDIDKMISRLGGKMNAFTDTDYTMYFETIPSSAMDTALMIESERMRNAAFDPKEVEAERTVVISEREGAENQPEFAVEEELWGLAFHVHPYHWTAIGYKQDLATLDRDPLYRHYLRYYAPNNASLVLVGGFDPAVAMQHVREAFGALKPETPPDPLRLSAPAQHGERRPGARRLPRPRRGGPRPGGREAAEGPAAEGRAGARPRAGPRLGPVRTRRRHVPGNPPQRGRRPRLVGLRGGAPREDREGPRGTDPVGRPDVPGRRPPDRRAVPRPGGLGVNLPDRTVLENGAVLLSHALPSNPFIAFRGSVPAGVAAEGSDQGVAEFTSRLLLNGTRTMSAAKLADRLEGIGATLEFHGGEEVLTFQGRCTRETAAETVRILVECLARPTFPPKEIERVRGELLNDVRMEADDTRTRAFRELARLVFPKDHPYGRDPKGGESRIRRIRRGDIVSFHEAHVGPEGLILAATGDVDRTLLDDAIATPLSRLRGDEGGPPAIPPPPPHRPGTGWIPMPHKTQVDVAIGAPGVPRPHADYYALNLANLLFGRIGLYGRLGRNLRDEQGLAYYAFSSLDARTAGGMWSISAGVNPANLGKAIESIRSELDRLRTEPFTLDEIRDGKDNQVGSLIVSLERNAEVASELHRMEYYGLGMDFLERYPDVIGDLTGERVRDVARKYFLPSASSMVIAGPVGRARFRL